MDEVDTGHAVDTAATPTRDSPPAHVTEPTRGVETAADTAAALDDRAHAHLLELRDSIDNLDAALVHLLAERFKCTKQVGELKARHGLPAADPGREAEQIARLRELAIEAKLDPEFAEKILAFIVGEVIRHHRALAAG